MRRNKGSHKKNQIYHLNLGIRTYVLKRRIEQITWQHFKLLNHLAHREINQHKIRSYKQSEGPPICQKNHWRSNKKIQSIGRVQKGQVQFRRYNGLWNLHSIGRNIQLNDWGVFWNSRKRDFLRIHSQSHLLSRWKTKISWFRELFTRVSVDIDWRNQVYKIWNKIFNWNWLKFGIWSLRY